MFPVLTAWVGAGCIKTSEKNGKGCKLLTLSLPSFFFFQPTCKGWYLSNQFPNSKRHNNAVTTTLMLVLMKLLLFETSSYPHPPVHQEDLFQNHKTKVDILPKLAQNWWQLFLFDVLGEYFFFFLRPDENFPLWFPIRAAIIMSVYKNLAPRG